MAKANDTSTVETSNNAETFCHGLFAVSDGVSQSTKIEEALVFLASGIDGIGDIVASGDVSGDRLWGYLRLIEAAKALVDSVNAEMAEGGAA